jgi:hypothetical protein
MNVGLIGAGPRATILANATRTSPIARNISRVTSRSRDSSERFAKVWNDAMSHFVHREEYLLVPSTLDEILEDPTIDSVIIAATIDQQPDLIYRSIQANKHVFVEKPGPVSSHEAQAFLDLAMDKRVIVAIGFSWIDEVWADNFSFLPDWRRIDITWQRPLFPDKAPIALNLAVHPISWLVKTAPITGGVFNPTVDVTKSSLGLRYSFKWPGLEREAYINLIESDSRSREILIQMNKNGEYLFRDAEGALASSPGRATSVQRQILRFFSAIRDGSANFTNDLMFAKRVLSVAEVGL